MIDRLICLIIMHSLPEWTTQTIEMNETLTSRRGYWSCERFYTWGFGATVARLAKIRWKGNGCRLGRCHSRQLSDLWLCLRHLLSRITSTHRLSLVTGCLHRKHKRRYWHPLYFKSLSVNYWPPGAIYTPSADSSAYSPDCQWRGVHAGPQLHQSHLSHQSPQSAACNPTRWPNCGTCVISRWSCLVVCDLQHPQEARLNDRRLAHLRALAPPQR